MKQRVAIKSYYILTLALVLFGTVGFGSLRNAQRVLKSSEDLAAVRIRVDLLNSLLTSLLQAESAQRGYLLTADPVFLGAYNSAAQDALITQYQIGENFQDERAQIEKLHLLVDAKIASLHHAMDVRSAHGSRAAAEAINCAAEDSRTEEIQRIVAELRQWERARYDAKTALTGLHAHRSLWSTALLITFSGSLVVLANTMIFLDSKKRRQAEQEKNQAQQEIVARTRQVENTARETQFLNDFIVALGTSLVDEEAYKVTSAYLTRLFPNAQGNLAMLNNSHNQLESAMSWNPPLLQSRAWRPEECHALRSGKTYEREVASLHLVCSHVADAEIRNYICVPLMAQGEMLGVLHLDFGAQKWEEHELNLLARLTDRLASKLANLRLREKLRLQSIRDPLTDLYNRRYMEESLERELSRAARKSTQVAVIMADLDHFKTFNDSYGHEAGDHILQVVAHTLRDSFRREDIVCRYGGEELLIILPETDSDEALTRADSARERIRQTRMQHHEQVLGPITASFGVASYPQDANSAVELICQADAALYQAKHAGRDRVVLCSDLNSGPLQDEPAV